jgi:hypothetical protein
MKQYAIVIIFSLLIPTAYANALLAPFTVEDLAKQSKYIVIGKVADIKPVLSDDKAISSDGLDAFLFDVTMYVERDLTGKYNGDTITFRIMDDRNSQAFSKSLEDPQKFVIGERDLVFLSDKEPSSMWGDSYYVTGTVLGKYTLVGGMAYGAEYPDGIEIPKFLEKVQQHISPSNKVKIKLAPEISDLTVLQEKFSTLYVNFTLDKNYEINSVFPYVKGLPYGVISQIGPENLSSSDMKGNTASVMIVLYANHGAKPGKYLLDVMSLGYIQNIDTAKLVPTKDKVLGKISLTIQENKKPISLDAGKPVFHDQNFCDNQTRGQLCQGTGFVEYPITVFSDIPTSVRLDVSDHSKEIWTKITPSQLVSLPNGTSAKLITAGFQNTYTIPMPDKDVWSIVAESQNDRAVAFFPRTMAPPLPIIHSGEPISSQDTVYAKTNGTSFTTLGVIYEPPGSSQKPIPVSLSYMGLVKGNDVERPSWLSVEFPDSPFMLNPSELYFFPVKITTNHAVSGGYWMSINQIVDGKQFVQRLNLNIFDSPELMDWKKFTTDEIWNNLVKSYNLDSPIRQLKQGIEPEEIQCKEGQVFAVKASNGNPICVKPSTLEKLIQRWTMELKSDRHIINGKYAGIDTEVGQIQIGKNWYFIATLDPSLIGYSGEGKKAELGGLVFTLFPRPAMLNLGGTCIGSFGASIKFPDNTYEKLNIDMPDSSCSINFAKTILTNHTDPQAGIIVIGDQIKLLASSSPHIVTSLIPDNP